MPRLDYDYESGDSLSSSPSVPSPVLLKRQHLSPTLPRSSRSSPPGANAQPALWRRSVEETVAPPPAARTRQICRDGLTLSSGQQKQQRTSRGAKEGVMMGPPVNVANLFPRLNMNFKIPQASKARKVSYSRSIVCRSYLNIAFNRDTLNQ